MGGGIDAWHGLVSRAELEQGEFVFRGDETAAEILAMAVSIEEQTRLLYEEVSQKAKDPALRSVAERLSKAEIGHREQARHLCRRLCPQEEMATHREAAATRQLLEGGMTFFQVLERFPDAYNDSAFLLDFAMSVEVDALDFYLRVAIKFKDEKSKQVLLILADEEKQHLRQLAVLREKVGPEPPSS